VTGSRGSFPELVPFPEQRRAPLEGALPGAQGLLSAIAAPAAITDADGLIVLANAGWNEVYPGLGAAWIAAVDGLADSAGLGAHVGQSIAAGVRAVCSGLLPSFTLDYADWRGASLFSGALPPDVDPAVVAPSGRGQRWYEFTIRPIAGWSGAMLMRTDVTSRYGGDHRIKIHERFDALTGLFSRVGLRERLASRLSTGLTSGPALLIADIDGFKAVNDGIGYLAGDEVLLEAARRLHEACGATLVASNLDRMPTLARLGGDEFAVLLPHADLAEAEEVANRLVRLHEAPFSVAGLQLSLGISVGVAVADEEHNMPGDIMRDADAAMNLAKSSGRGRHQVFGNELRDGAVRRLRILDRLRLALEDPRANGLRLEYQPIVSFADGRTYGFEALARWNDDTLGRVMPLEFIGLAEDTGLIVPIGAWALSRACEQMRDRVGMRVSVNVSPRQLADARLLDVVDATLEQTGFPADRLTLEITESAVVADVRGAAETLTSLRERGVNIALDDFGTGWSSLGQLRNLPVDRLKVDRVFVDALGRDEGATGVVTAIVALARGLGMQVTAEGVETPDQLERLRDLGVDDAQGYLLGRPAPLHEHPMSA
jgi:Amt family ammonium transporter